MSINSKKRHDAKKRKASRVQPDRQRLSIEPENMPAHISGTIGENDYSFDLSTEDWQKLFDVVEAGQCASTDLMGNLTRIAVLHKYANDPQCLAEDNDESMPQKVSILTFHDMIMTLSTIKHLENTVKAALKLLGQVGLDYDEVDEAIKNLPDEDDDDDGSEL